MARLRTRVERAATLHRQAAAAVTTAAHAVDGYSPASAPAEQYAEQHDLAARLRAAAAELIPGWLGASLDAAPAAMPLQDAAVPAYVRLGLAHPLDDARFPAVAPLLGAGHLAIDADARDPRTAGLLRSLLLRLVAAAAPGTLRIRVIDAACAGEATAAFSGIGDLMPPPATDHPGLQSALLEAEGWLQTPGRPDEYLVLVIASLPELTDGNDLTRISRLARTGVGRRLHLIVAGWPPPPLTAETTQPPLPYSTQLSLRNPYAWVGDPPGATYSGSGVGPSRLNAPVYLDPDPPADLIRRVCTEIAAAEHPTDRPPWTSPVQRWAEYVAAAQRLDRVRRDATKVVTEQTAALKRARAEAGQLRSQLTAQQSRIAELVRGGRPVMLVPTAAELAAAGAALMRLSQPPPGAAVTSATAAGSRRPVPFSRPEGGGSARAPGAGPAPTGPATAPARPAAVEAQRTRPVPAAAHPVHVNTGSFRVVGSPPTAPTSVPVSSPPVPFAAPPPAVIPRLPDAALVLLVEARAAMARAEVELSDVDARANNPASMRNAMVYAAYAGVFAFVQLPMTAMLSASDRLPTILGAPCGLSSVVLSFILAWLTIGFLYQQPGGQRPPRSPMLGAVISLIAAVPVVAAVAWTVWSAVSD